MYSLRISSIVVLLCASSSIGEGAAEAPSRHVEPGNVFLPRRLVWRPTHRLSRHRRAENEDASQAKRRRSIIAALDAYFGFPPPLSDDAAEAGDLENFTSKRSAVKAVAMDSEGQRHSKKKDLIQGTLEMVMAEKGHDGSVKGAEMPMVVFTDDSAYENMAMSEEERKKMTAMVDHLLSDMMHSNLMKSFNMDSLPSVMNGHHFSDLVHSIDHPMMDDFNHPHLTNSSHSADNFLLDNFTSEQSHLSPEGGHFASEGDPNHDASPSASTTSGAAAAAPNIFNPELEFTTLEVDLGPAILPLQVPEGYFVPFVPRKAFGVANGVARPPHGHASFYVHRPAGLVDVPNSPAFGFLFSGHSRSPDIEPVTPAPARLR